MDESCSVAEFFEGRVMGSMVVECGPLTPPQWNREVRVFIIEKFGQPMEESLVVLFTSCCGWLW